MPMFVKKGVNEKQRIEIIEALNKHSGSKIYSHAYNGNNLTIIVQSPDTMFQRILETYKFEEEKY